MPDAIICCIIPCISGGMPSIPAMPPEAPLFPPVIPMPPIIIMLLKSSIIFLLFVAKTSAPNSLRILSCLAAYNAQVNSSNP